MAICATACNLPTPAGYGACGIVPKEGGIDRLAFIACDYTFTDITDQVEWDAAIAASDVSVSGKVIGEKPKGTFTNKRVSSCLPEVTVAAEKVINFQDYNSDPVAGGTAEFAFWNAIQADPTRYQLAWITCDGWVYGVVSDFTIEVDEVIEDTKEGNRFIDGSIKFSQKALVIPTQASLVF